MLYRAANFTDEEDVEIKHLQSLSSAGAQHAVCTVWELEHPCDLWVRFGLGLGMGLKSGARPPRGL